MLAVVLGLVVAAGYGSGDYIGGRASRRSSATGVLVVSSVVSVTGALAVSLVAGGSPTGRDLALGTAAGALNVCGLALLYAGLARYGATLVAPVTAVVGAVFPITWGVVAGERPSGAAAAGMVLAVAAAGVIAWEPGAVSTRVAAGVGPAGAAGCFLGSSFVLFSEVSESSGLWPVASARLAALLVIGAAALRLASARRLRVPAGVAAAAAAAGALDVTANTVLLVAVRQELVSIVAAIAALAPAFTVLLAWVAGGERVSALRRGALAVALGGLFLIARG